jgi:glutathione S-transferase
MKLYDRDVSGNCYKVRLFLALLGMPYEKVAVDTAAGANRTPEFLKLNPRGQIPVLDDGGKVFWDSTAILVYVARRYGGERWLPGDPEGMAEVTQWLALAQNEILFGLARARAIRLFNRPGNLEEFQKLGRRALDVLEPRLAGHDWLALDHCTIADVACYPYVGLAPQGEISLEPYAAVRRWIERVRALPGYVGMPGL